MKAYFWFLHSGEIEQMIDDRAPVRLHAGASIFIPADVYHATLNVGWKPAELFIIYAPPGPERFFRTLPGCTVTPPEVRPKPRRQTPRRQMPARKGPRSARRA